MFLAASTGASAQSSHIISNTAVAEWDSGPTTLSRPSNTVQIPVEDEPPAPPTIELFHFSTDPGSTQIPVPQTMCVGSSGTVPVQLGGAFSGYSTNPASLIPAQAIRAGEPLVIQVAYAAKNVDSGAVDRFEVAIATANGDRERLVLTETGVNTGVFIGMINTAAIPPAPVQGDCVLSVHPGDKLEIRLRDGGVGIGTDEVNVLVDPYGLTFDSGDAAPVNGSTVTIVDANTGAPTQVFGDDGASAFPSTLVTGSTVTDSSGHVYAFESGFYRFPFVRPGTYRLLVTPPSPYRHPSAATPAEIALLTRPDGGAFAIGSGSYGGSFTLNAPAPVRIDIPLDRSGGAIALRKTTSTTVAMPGDVVQYRIEVKNPDSIRNTGPITVSDFLPPTMRMREYSVRYQGNTVVPTFDADGRNFSVSLPPLAAGQSGILTYLAEVRQDAQPGDAMNLAAARDNRGAASDTSDATIRIVRDGISERFTIVGRITEGGCTLDPRLAKGIAGVRVMLEDGTYTVTDKDGRYHFEGMIPGIHVVQVDPESFPLDMAPVDCARNTRSAGSAISRFVEGRGGLIKRADFYAKTVPARTPKGNAAKPLPEALSDPEAAGADRDWFTGQEPGTAFLFPELDYNPRVRAVRVAIKHLPGQTIDLSVNGKPVDALAYDGLKKNWDGSVLVSIWRGIAIEDGDNELVAIVKDANGTVVDTLKRKVYYTRPPMNAQLLKAESVLSADGIIRPRIAVRLTDRAGHPVQHGAVGDFTVNAPYTAAIDADAQQAEQLSGLERARPVWRVHGDEGIAYVELEPTTASGTVNIGFSFRDGETIREQSVETWLEPGDRPWTVVGFAAGTVGFNKLSEGLEQLPDISDDLSVDGRIALYAQGRVSGKWLMTLAFDSDKKESEQRLSGVIDPKSYYTIYADRAEQRYDAASVRKLYVKLERKQFYAMFGDYTTGIDEPELSRYQRNFNGIKAEFHNDNVQAQVFAADTPYRFRREEIQGNGLSGPYALASRDILANSEIITLETRDRLRSDKILDRKTLVRHIDYDIDYLAGTLRFREPILSRSSGLDPQFIIAEYEVNGIGERVKNAGGRVRWNSDDKKLQIGATAIHDETDIAKTNLVGADVVYRPAAGTEIRAEVATTDGKAKPGTTVADAGTATAWLVEAEHHDEKVDLSAYYREQEAGFGVGQTNASEIGTRKFGAEARAHITNKLSISALGYQEDYIETGARRRVAQSEVQYRDGSTTVTAGVTHANDLLADGTTKQSTLAKLAGSQKLLDGKLELNAQTEFAINDQDESIDFPARHSIGARYSIRPDIQIVGGYEIAKGETIDARTARIGFDIAPWAGGRITASGNQQEITEYGPRTFAAYGLAQSFKLNDKWSLDFTLDGNKTLNGFNRDDVLNPLHPVASGGFLGSDQTLTEDFTAITAGATYRNGDWAWTGRAEWRDGEDSLRYGATAAILRQIGEGQAIGGAINWFRAKTDAGAETTTSQAEISWAHRPANSRFSILNKLEYRYDAVKNAIAGQAGPIGGVALTIDGNAKSTRVINSLSINYTPLDADDGIFTESDEYSFFWGTRFNTDQYGAGDVKGWSNVFGADFRLDLSDIIDIGGQGTIRIGTNAKNIAWSAGPALTLKPFDNANITLGYNFVGFEDRDFEEQRYTRSGPFLTFKLKFDQQSLAGFKF